MNYAYYNENDEFAAQWLRNLIAARHIADGYVDQRSIEDVRPDDLVGFAQCHFFAGIGVWSYALRRAGWPDDRPVWTGSCPCQPFSAAGKGGGFADERHLWPAFFHLIGERKPVVVFGEQVASRDGLTWLDLVADDMEGTGYAFAAVDTCAAGFGAPHIRQRLYWVADTQARGLGEHGRASRQTGHPAFEHATGRMADSNENGRRALPIDRCNNAEHHTEPCGQSGRMDNNNNKGLEGQRDGHQAEGGRIVAAGSVATAGESGGVADTNEVGHDRSGPRSTGRNEPADCGNTDRPGPTNGLWQAADWLFCRDGKWRPVEPGTFPLAHGAPARVGRLRAYGNAIVAPQAEEVIRAYLTADIARAA